jgi:pantoate kinase
MVSATPIAFSPGSVTCFFSPVVKPAPEETYSRGLAINLSHGVTAAVRPAPSTRLYFNGRPFDMPPVRHVLDALAPEPMEVQFETPLPLGCGFGVSAACALTAAFAVARRYALPKSRAELGLVAHVAEVVNRTGFGDVASQLCGGFVYRRCRAGPLDALRLATPDAPLYYRTFGEIRTAQVLNSAPALAAIAEEGRKALDWLEQNLARLTLGRALDRSLEFARNARLFTDRKVVAAVQDVLAAGGHATMIMLGQSILSTLPAPAGAGWTECEVDNGGTRWLP